MPEYILPNSKAQNQSVLKNLSCFQGKGKINVSVPSGVINRSKSIDFTKKMLPNALKYILLKATCKQDSNLSSLLIVHTIAFPLCRGQVMVIFFDTRLAGGIVF